MARRSRGHDRQFIILMVPKELDGIFPAAQIEESEAGTDRFYLT